MSPSPPPFDRWDIFLIVAWCLSIACIIYSIVEAHTP